MLPTVKKSTSISTNNLKLAFLGASLAAGLVSTHAVASPYTDTHPLTEPELSPSKNSINEVVSYYYGSEDTPILADFKLCESIGSAGAERNECVGEVPLDTLTRGQTVYLWMSYLVPKGTKSNLLMHYNYDGITRDASNLTVRGSIRYRTWKKIKLSRSGSWELPIYVEKLGQYEELSRIELDVKDQNYAGL